MSNVVAFTAVVELCSSVKVFRVEADRGVAVADLDLDVRAADGAELDHHLAQPHLLAHVEDQPGARLQAPEDGLPR
jgi:hypothetical protein